MKYVNNFLVGALCTSALLYGFYNNWWVLPFVDNTTANTTQSDVVTDFVSGDEAWSGSVVYDATAQFEKFQRIFELLEVSYYDTEEIDIEKMLENATKWFVDALWDPYTVYLTPDENQIFDEWMQGSQNFEWIGAVVTKKDDGIMVESVLKWSPAFKSGIKPLDLIVKIWEISTSDLWLHEWVELIRWEKWTDVMLTIYRKGTNGEVMIEEIPVTRDTISVPSVEDELIQEWWKELLYITLSVFWEDTVVLLERLLKEYQLENIDGVILDLRGNGWWYLPMAVELASYFLPKSTLVTTARYSIFEDEEYRSKWYKLLESIPTVVLIDGMSASASEIIATSLRDRADATLIGQQTFGKWSIQTIQQNDDSSSLKYTIWKRYTPDWDNIDQEWVEPDIAVEFDREAFEEDESDSQLEAAKEFLLSQ